MNNPAVTTLQPAQTVPQHVVSLRGYVVKPGFYRVASGSRIIDVINTAGGVTVDADVSLINLASTINSDTEIYVPNNGVTPSTVIDTFPTAPKSKYHDYARLAKLDDVIGIWELVQWPQNVQSINKVNPWPMPYQHFGFYSAGVMRSVMSNFAQNTTAKELDEAFKILPSTMSYRVPQDGLMAVSYSYLKDKFEVWGVLLMVKEYSNAGVELRRGDLLMILLDRSGSPLYYRHLRKLQ